MRVFLSIVATVALASCGPAKPPLGPAEVYPAPWVQPSAEVYRTLYASGFRCGEGYQRGSIEAAGEYLLYCREANGQWTTYLVWPTVAKVLGPDRTYAYTKGIPLPERSDAAQTIAP